MLRIVRQPLQLCRAAQRLTAHSAAPVQLDAAGIQLLRTFSVSVAGRRASTQQQPSKNELAAAREQADVSTDVRPMGERVKENAKTVSYLGVIVLGAVVTGGLVFAILRELWSSSSPNNVYSAALERCVNDPRIQDALGAPIKGFGEETSRRRRTHVAHSVYERNGVQCMRMQFYVQGIRNKATVQLEVQENSSGNYEYRYLFAQLDNYPRNTIILEDNRAAKDSVAIAAPTPLPL